MTIKFEVFFGGFSGAPSLFVEGQGMTLRQAVEEAKKQAADANVEVCSIVRRAPDWE